MVPQRLGPLLHLHVCVSQLTQDTWGCFPHKALHVFGCPCWHLGTWISVPDSGGSLVLHCANHVVLWEQLLSFWGPELLVLVGRGVLMWPIPNKNPWALSLWWASLVRTWSRLLREEWSTACNSPYGFLPFVDCAVFFRCNKSSLWPRP